MYYYLSFYKTRTSYYLDAVILEGGAWVELWGKEAVSWNFASGGYNDVIPSGRLDMPNYNILFARR